MMKSSLRTKILLSVGIIIFVVLGTSTLVHIRDLKRDYLEAVEWRSEALAQGMLKVVNEYSQFSMNIQSTLESLALECMDIYELNQDNVTHVAVINVDGEFAAHNNRELWNKSIESPLLLDSLKDPKRKTILDGEIYHTFVPIYGTEGLRGEEGVYLGIINIGFPKSVVDKEVNKVLVQSVMFFGIFLILALSAISLLMHFLITNPVRHLVRVGQQLAEGNPVPLSHTPGRGDEVTYLRTSFNQISAYFRDIAEVASHVATGVIASEVPIRSKQDILGKAVDEMLHYLKHIADVAAKVAEGDLTETVFIRSANDAFGRVIQTMTEGLRSLIVQIRSSSEQIASTGTMISSLTERDFDIVERVYTAAEHMTSTMQEIGSSVEKVAHNMGTLSSSVEETSASVSQMAMSITHIASKADALTSQTNQAIASLDEAVNSLEGVVESTDVSKRLSQETIQDALGGQEAVEQVMNSMETIQQTVTTSVDAINRFAQRSRDIDTILDVIREITDQTSLLALNASIIAAQAGTHGRGFAVVADEIRNLANGVGNSTKDISSIIHTLQTDTDMVVQTIHAGAEDVKLGMERTQQAREKLQKITASAQQSSSVVTEIAETLHDLMATSRGLSNAMEQVNIMTNDITAATNEQKASTTQISETTTHINEMASQIQQATTEQLTGVHQLLEATNNVTILIDQNLESSRQVAHTAADLLAQADILLKSVDRFKLKAA